MYIYDVYKRSITIFIISFLYILLNRYSGQSRIIIILHNTISGVKSRFSPWDIIVIIEITHECKWMIV